MQQGKICEVGLPVNPCLQAGNSEYNQTCFRSNIEIIKKVKKKKKLYPPFFVSHPCSQIKPLECKLQQIIKPHVVIQKLFTM